MSVLPNFIIAGTNKSGTTSLFSYLSEHPNVCASSIKETCYFLPIRYGNEIEPIEVYNDKFSHHTAEKIIMEATPGYFYGSSQLAEKIKEIVGPNVKIIVVLREPISRAFSFFKFMKTRLLIDGGMSFSEYIEGCKSYATSDFKNQSLNPYFGLEGGKYVDYISDWECFDESQIKFLFFDDLKNNMIGSVKSISDWLGIDGGFYDDFTFAVENKTVAFKNKGLQKIALAINNSNEKFFRKNQALKKKLRNIYYKFNSSNEKEELDQMSKEILTNYYRPYNEKLRQYMDGKNISYPDWLNN